MSETTTTPPVSTADQPSIHPDNILAHPGSTAAGVAILLALLTYVSTHPVPSGTDWATWVGYIATAIAAVLAGLGK